MHSDRDEGANSSIDASPRSSSKGPDKGSHAHLQGRLVDFVGINIDDGLRNIMRQLLKTGFPTGWRFDIGTNLPRPELEDHVVGRNQLDLPSAAMDVTHLPETANRMSKLLAWECPSMLQRDSEGTGTIFIYLIESVNDV